MPLVDPELVRYVAAHTIPEDAFLTGLRREAVAEGIPEIEISFAQASFMQILLKLCGARELVEVGTLAGYSAIALARALPEAGRVWTIEVDGTHAAFARRKVSESDVADRIEVLEGDARTVLPEFASESADAAFIDADKINYPAYFEQCLRIVRPGGLVMVDNALAFGQLLDESPEDVDVPHIRAFNDSLVGDERVHAFLVPVGDGCWVARKKGRLVRAPETS